MHVAGSIVFFWYGKCWRLPYYRTNVGAHNTVHVLTKAAKHSSGMACQYCPVGVQGTVLDIAVDLSALPYLLRLILCVLIKRAFPFGRFPIGSDRTGRRRAVSRGSVYSWLEKWVRVGSECRPLFV